eukprot:4556455-Amphidinium_carterae.1
MRRELGPTEVCAACERAGRWGHGMRRNAKCRIMYRLMVDQMAIRTAQNEGASPPIEIKKDMTSE